jgi:alternate signal-mediated exported protein
MKKNKKLLLTMSISILVMIVIVGVTLALFTSSDKVTNVFGVGNIDVEIEEIFPIDPPEWNQEGPIKKEVNIKNVATDNDALIRVNITPRWVKEENGKEIPWAGDASDKVVKLNFVNIVEDSTSKGKWIYGNDGYYYYTSILDKNENTSNILDSVEVNINETTVENPKDYEDKTLIVDVNAEAVQPTIEAYENTWNVLDDNIKGLLNNLINSYN